jgi:hypothetical protein
MKETFHSVTARLPTGLITCGPSPR